MKNLIFSSLICFACAYSFSQSPRILVPFRSGSKLGYSDTLGKLKIQPRYDTVSLFDYNGITRRGHVIATVRLKGKPMVINEMGTVIVPPNYDHIQVMDQLEDFAFFVSRKGKFGVFTKGKELFPPLYDYMDVTTDAQFKVHKNGKWGLINSEGILVIPIIYDELRQTHNIQSGFVSWEGITYGKDSKSYTIKTGQRYRSSDVPEMVRLSEDMYIHQENWSKAIESAKTEYSLDSVVFKKNSGIIYKSAKPGVFLPKEAKKVYFFSKNYTIYYIKYFATEYRNSWNKGAAAYIIAGLNGKYGMINETEDQVLPFEYDSIEERDGFFLLKRNGKVGFFIWNTFYPVIQPAYDEYVWKEYIPVSNEWNFTLFKVVKKGKSGFVGENGIAFFKD